MADVPEPPPDLLQQPAGTPDTRVLAGAADAGDAAEALAALQGSAANAMPPAPLLENPGAATSAVHAQAPGAPPQTNPPASGQRIPGMGRGTSLYRGVSKAGDKKKWRAMIQYNHEQHHVGYYPTAEEAARAYDRKALLFMGPSAITNFPPTDYAGEDLTAEGTAEEQAKKRRRTSSFRGVTRAGGKWKAAIRANNVKKDLGVFEDELDAARAYDAAAVQLLGPAAVTNFNKDDVMAALPQAAAEQVAAESAPLPSQALQDAQLPSSGAQEPSGASVQSVQATVAPTAQGSPLWPQLPAGNGALLPPTLAVPLLRFHGVRPTSNGKWHAQVVVEVGRFDTEEEAARAYDRAAVWCLGLTAQTNFPINEVIQPGPLGGQGAPLQATSQAQPDQVQPDQAQPDQGGVPSYSDDEDRAREAGPSDVAMPDQATHDLAAGGPPPNFGQEPLGYNGGQYMAAMEQAGQPASGQATGQDPGTSGHVPSSAPGNTASNSRQRKASRFVGLSKKFNRWKALIKICGRRKELGSFPGEEEAARCYDRHSVLAWGARAKTNFNPLELLAEMPKDALTVLDAVLAGRRERAESGRPRGGGGAISEAVASALSSHPAGVDSSTKEGQEAHAAIASAMAGHSYKKSAHRGVSANWSRWRAQIYVGGRRHELGSFTTEGEAARAYDLAAIKLYGPDKAKTNFPVEDYRSMLEAGAATTAPSSSGAHGATAGSVPESMPATTIDGQVLTAELQALVMAQLRAAGHMVGQPGQAPDHEALLSQMLAQAAQAVPPQAVQQQQAFPSPGPPAST
ncbi:probable AP2-like ethylene-responsive transcription factor PLT2 [Coccomyxa sp. Obi]|nr:probable AP2-like ethylene-responsive transcription factor PLT2 [Coccomyxa sp. Obi]